MLDCADICQGHDDRVDGDGDQVPDGCDLCLGHDDRTDADGDEVPDGSDVCPGGDDRIDENGNGTPDDCEWEWTVMLPGGVPLVLVQVPAGTFQMGSPATERSRNSDEGPVHTVTIGYAFYMGKTEVTQRQWLALMGSWPGTAPSFPYGWGAAYPAYYVSWDDAKDFIAALNAHLAATGQGPLTVRLPSEAEWEYACRAGTQTRFSFGDSLGVDDQCEDDGVRSQYMWYCGNDRDWGTAAYGTKPVGTKLPNRFGLYDMHGNVWEWCEDWWHSSYSGAPVDGSARVVPTASYRVRRGGFWESGARICRSADRRRSTPTSRLSYMGFRLAAVR